MVVIAVASASLVLIMSVMNGMNDLVESLYANFSPDIIIQPKEGKSFNLEELSIKEIKDLEEVEWLIPTKEAVVLLKYNDQQEVANLKGVSNDYFQAMGLNKSLAEPALVKQHGHYFSVIGIGLAYKLGLSRSFNPMINIYAPGDQTGSIMNSENYFRSKLIENASTYSVNDEFDTKYMLVHNEFMDELLDTKGRYNSLEIQLSDEVDVDHLKQIIQEKVSDRFEVKTRFEQHEFLLKSLNSEKWVALLVLSFIMMIAFFNLTGSLIMLMIDKKKDTQVLIAMGATRVDIKKIFFLEGIWITLLGSIIGIVIGSLLVGAQNWLEIVKIQGSFVISAYPVKWVFIDTLMILSIVVGIGAVASYLPTRRVYN